MMSACLGGKLCGWDGTDNGFYVGARNLYVNDKVQIIPFCPEDFSYGTPREMSDIHGGNGYDVLDGKARVLTASGKDWTEGMINAAKRMSDLALKQQVELAVLLDISAACGSQMIYLGDRTKESPIYQMGPGVAAAHLIRSGIKVISQRDFASLELLYKKLDQEHKIDLDAIDHHQTEWYVEFFNEK